jgi:hypothetical protein
MGSVEFNNGVNECGNGLDMIKCGEYLLRSRAPNASRRSTLPNATGQLLSGTAEYVKMFRSSTEMTTTARLNTVEACYLPPILTSTVALELHRGPVHGVYETKKITVFPGL